MENNSIIKTSKGVKGYIMEMTCKLGKIEILLPDASTSYFFIDDDLAELFNLKTNNEALKLLRKTIREKVEPNIYKRIGFDYESSAVIIRTTNAEFILEIALIINEIAKVSLAEQEIGIVKNQLLSHKRPKKQKWEVGDIFQIPLENGTHAFGQIVWKDYTHPVCGLFDINKTEIPSLVEIMSYPFISILSLTPNSLDNHRWKVLGNTNVRIQKEDVPKEFNGTDCIGARSFSSGTLEDLANAVYGVKPWNVFAEEDYFDQILLPSIKRPLTAKVLSLSERNPYRKEKKWE
ncbi:immunity 26/phosphotriesterase HocA family protein [Rossellomorea sp. SC111]|uniref:immunity 26/phosphotriesterase HocA family protein n=1 Tax=Rossellomorea sp. SC111 TaxID=2968985 RepID=UPI00215AD7A1|nr:immunity 26/phosphotriesterase HocA family protein [Rossellomorea sp. SC111]MCR8848377.1 immunity 26/phosphotriesterase HocA family protein [Rossellomorea sp. SC111]